MDKVLENRLRRIAHRQGFRLLKYRRDITFEGYQLVEEIEGGGAGHLVFGKGNMGRGYAATLAEIEAWLTSNEIER
jgi:hypothetical protein